MTDIKYFDDLPFELDGFSIAQARECIEALLDKLGIKNVDEPEV